MTNDDIEKNYEDVTSDFASSQMHFIKTILEDNNDIYASSSHYKKFEIDSMKVLKKKDDKTIIYKVSIKTKNFLITEEDIQKLVIRHYSNYLKSIIYIVISSLSVIQYLLTKNSSTFIIELIFLIIVMAYWFL